MTRKVGRTSVSTLISWEYMHICVIINAWKYQANRSVRLGVSAFLVKLVIFPFVDNRGGNILANLTECNVTCMKNYPYLKVVLRSFGSPTPPPIINVGLEQAVESHTGQKSTLILGRGARAGLAKYFRHDCLRMRKIHEKWAKFDAP